MLPSLLLLLLRRAKVKGTAAALTLDAELMSLIESAAPSPYLTLQALSYMFRCS